MRLDTKFFTHGKALVFGTALWGWTVSKKEAFKMLDCFSSSNILVDTAMNYPIDSVPSHYGLALKWISEWNRSNSDMINVIVKIGATENSGKDSFNLSMDYIRYCEQFLRDILGNSLSCISIHWDKRGRVPTDVHAVSITVDEFRRIHNSGLAIGLSGIANPIIYFEAAPDLSHSWIIQVKENATTNTARKSYFPWFSESKYFAYGINMGGIKELAPEATDSITVRGLTRDNALILTLMKELSASKIRDVPPQNLNELALFRAHSNPALKGVIIGPTSCAQLNSTIVYWNRLKENLSC